MMQAISIELITAGLTLVYIVLLIHQQLKLSTLDQPGPAEKRSLANQVIGKKEAIV